MQASEEDGKDWKTAEVLKAEKFSKLMANTNHRYREAGRTLSGLDSSKAPCKRTTFNLRNDNDTTRLGRRKNRGTPSPPGTGTGVPAPSTSHARKERVTGDGEEARQPRILHPAE